jgi:hypothetical protein
LYSVRTALESLFVLQKSNGQLPYAGKGFRPSVSYTYHLHSLIGASYLYRFSGEKGWLSNHWSQYKRGLEWAIGSVDETGLANITSSSDWLRFGMGAHVSIPPSWPPKISHANKLCRTSKQTQSSTSSSKTPNPSQLN